MAKTNEEVKAAVDNAVKTKASNAVNSVLSALKNATTKSDTASNITPAGTNLTSVKNDTTNDSHSISPTTTYQEDLSKLSQAQMRQQVNSLKQAREATLKSLDQEEEKINPTYQNARNNTTATSLKNAKSFNEYLANRGLSNSGSSAQAELNRTSTLNNNIASLNQSEAEAYKDIASRRQQAETTYNNGVANAQAGIDANYYQNLLNYNQNEREYLRNLDQQAIGQYADDYQAYMNTLDPNSYEYKWTAAARGDKIKGNLQGNQNNALASIQAGNINTNNAAALGWTIDQAQQYHDNYVAQQQAQAQAEAEQLAYDRQREQTNDYWTNAYKQAQINQMANKGNGNGTTEDKQLTTSQINTVINKLNEMETPEDQLSYINVLRDTGGLGTGDYADNMWRSLYNSIYGGNTTPQTTQQTTSQTTQQQPTPTVVSTNSNKDLAKEMAKRQIEQRLKK